MTSSPPPDGFGWSETRCGPVLRCQALESVADHFFTTRHLDLRGSDADARQGWRLVATSIGVEPERLERLVQVHGVGAIVLHASRAAMKGSADRPEGDILATNDSSVALAIQVADCAPILLADTRGRGVAAAHAGWRGTSRGIARAAVEVLRCEFGIRPSDLVVAIGPSIGPACYRVGEDLREAFLSAGHGQDAVARWFLGRGTERAGVRLDLWRANVEQLIADGVAPSSSHVAGLCTSTRADLFYSYRRDGRGTGRMAAVVRCRAIDPAV